MDSEIKSTETKYYICRICLQASREVLNLFSKEKSALEVLEKIHECFNVDIKFEKHFPYAICKKCIEDLNIAYNFWRKCLTFEERYLSLHDDDKLILNKQNPMFLQESKVEEYLADFNEDTFETTNIEIHEEFNKCTICNKSLKSKTSLLKHNVTMHQKRKHLGKVTGFGESRRYHCTKCSYCTPHSQTLVNHMRRHNGDRPYTCECGKSFTQSSSLAAHRKTHSDVTYYTCATCGKQFKHAFTLKKHLQVHEVGRYSCDICQKNLKSRQSLQDHIHRHYNIKNFSCEDCGDTFVTCSELINHKKKHSKVKKVECHLCGYKTHTKKSLIIHLKRHTGDKSYKCGLCELSFYTSGDLRRHLRVHTREKPYTCPTCAQRFTHSTSLNKHMHTVHGLDYKWGDFKFNDLMRTKKVQTKVLELKRQ